MKRSKENISIATSLRMQSFDSPPERGPSIASNYPGIVFRLFTPITNKPYYAVKPVPLKLNGEYKP